MSDALPAVPPLPPVLIGASSKAYLGLAELTRWVQVVTAGLGELGGGEGVAAPRAVPYLCMPAALLGPLGSTLTAAGMLVGAQDVSRFDPGAHTGETTAALLAELGASMAMIGHPERARDQHETLDECRGKALAAARNGIVPILIAGEPTRGADPETAIGPQLDVILADVTADFPVIVAYEPSWAIGQAEPAPAEHIAATTGAIRELLHARGRHNVRIVYGGSAVVGTFTGIVEAANDAAQRPDGIFLGRGGLAPENFLATIEEVRAVTRPSARTSSAN